MSGLGAVIPRLRWIALALIILLPAVSLTACSGRNSLWNDGPNYGPRVIPLGQPVPKGGGRYKLGKPYHDRDGRLYVPKEEPHYDRTGTASWYGEDFHGRRTANGEIYDMEALTAAHTTLPLPSYVRVTSLSNGRSLVVRVNDRGPYVGGRIIDLSWAVASLLQIEGAGTGPVRVQYLGPAPLDGNDKYERQILAQQSWAGPRVAYAASPAKALRSGGGWRQYSNVEPAADGGGETVREKFIRDRLKPAANSGAGPSGSNRPGTTSPQTAPTMVLASADVVDGAAPRRAPVRTKPTAPTPPKPATQAGLLPAAKPVPRPKAPSQTPLAPAHAPAQLAAKAQLSALPAPPHGAAHVKAAAAPAVSMQPAKTSGIYVEAGVFRERALADKLSAILVDVAPANVELTSSGTEIVHRVKVGPFDKTEAAEAAAARIRAAGLREARIIPARGI